MFMTEAKLKVRIQELQEYRYREAIVIPSFEMMPDEAGEVGAPPPAEGAWRTVSLGERWSGFDAYVWLKAEVSVPEEWSGRKVVGRFNFGKTELANFAGFESLLYLNGVAYQGVDSNHQEVPMPEAAGQSLSLAFRLWSGMINHFPLMLGRWETLGPVRRALHADRENGGKARPPVEHTLSQAELCWLDEAADDLYYWSRSALETLERLPDSDPTRHALIAALDRSWKLVDWAYPGSDDFYASVGAAREALVASIGAIPKHTPVTVNVIGHTHIDVAWLWQLKHTREKAARSFSTVLRLMEQFPEYVFLQSQPQLYEYIQSDYPELFARLKARIAEGRWEADGGMWLEADCNLTSGESLVRQLLYGTRYLKREFGVECKYLWLPDVFGYSWALPQLLRRSGIDSFMTCKINMGNQYNEMPHHTFKWRGIDGSEVLTHFAGYNYNGVIDAASMHGLWDRYKDKAFNRELLFAYGYGDGGGGVNRDMLEFRRRLDKMPGMPRVEPGRAGDYFDRLHRTVAETDQYVHTWDGELYFEYHRGTYTSQAFVKKMNRRCELGLREAEWLNALACAGRADWAAYPADLLYEAWKITLRNQFHDILPGSSIREVYEDCRREYAEAAALIGQASERALGRLVPAGEAGVYTVFNGASWSRDDTVTIPYAYADGDGIEAVATDGEGTDAAWSDREHTEAAATDGAGTDAAWSGREHTEAAATDDEGTGAVWTDSEGRSLPAQRSADGWLVRVGNVPSLGAVSIRRSEGKSRPKDESPFAVGASGIATPFYELEWNGCGQLVRLFDRQAGREVLQTGQRGNVLQTFEDKPLAHDAWDIDLFYEDKMREVDELEEVRVTEVGPLRAVVSFRWRFVSSVIRQSLIVYSGDRRIDFVTDIDWQERQTLLKTAFPVDIKASEATYDIQFGNVKRPTHWNTSWDYARFETVGHQWADLSEQGYGVSLLNDCKYGYDIKGGTMRLTLLKSAIYPDETADRGAHSFTYALLPHAGSWFEGGVVQSAWALNNPLTATGGIIGPDLDSHSLFRVSAPNVMIDAVKKTEDGDAVLVRFHEFAGGRGSVRLESDFPLLGWTECDLLERPVGEFSTDRVEVYVKPYEVRTFRIAIAARL